VRARRASRRACDEQAQRDVRHKAGQAAAAQQRARLLHRQRAQQHGLEVQGGLQADAVEQHAGADHHVQQHRTGRRPQQLPAAGQQAVLLRAHGGLVMAARRVAAGRCVSKLAEPEVSSTERKTLRASKPQKGSILETYSNPMQWQTYNDMQCEECAGEANTRLHTAHISLGARLAVEDEEHVQQALCPLMLVQPLVAQQRARSISQEQRGGAVGGHEQRAPGHTLTVR